MDNYSIKRSTERIPIEVPLTFDHGTGVTRDISFSGVYFKTKKPFSPGDYMRFNFELEFAVSQGPVNLDCQGYVLRVEKIGDQYGVASTIDEVTYLN